jgi:hypothetical protein
LEVGEPIVGFEGVIGGGAVQYTGETKMLGDPER